MTTYRLASSEFVFAPGFIRFAINGAAFEADRESMIKMVSQAWSLPREAAEALLTKKVPFTATDDGVVEFEA